MWWCSADWLHLNTFSPMKADLLRSRRPLNTWKTGFAIKASQCSSHLHRIKPWIQTLWFNCSGTQCWLTRLEHIFTCERCSITNQKTPQHLEKMVSPWMQFNVLAMLLDHTMNTHFLSPPQWHTVLTGSARIPVHPWNMLYTTDHKTLRNLENHYCHEHQLVFWPFSVNQAMITHMLAHYSSTEWWLILHGHPFAHERCSTKDQKAYLENRLCHKGKSVFWPLILN